MKNFIGIIILISLIFAQNAFSANLPNTISGPAEDIYCSEIDPFIGDQCVVYTTDKKTGHKYGLIFNDYIWASVHISSSQTINDFIGDDFTVEFCDAIYDKDLISEHKSLNKDYFYLSCNEDLFFWQDQTFTQTTVLKNITANIDSVWCGELNPYTNDLCIITAKDKRTNQVYSFLFEDFEWMNKYLKSDEELETIKGQSFKISSCEKTGDINIVKELNNTSRDNVYKCPINNFSWQ